MAAPLVIVAFWLMVPAYLANMLATLVGGGPPIDGGRVWRDGRRILGDGKTWRGLIVAPVLAAAMTGIPREIARVRPEWGLSTFGPDPWWLLIAWGLGVGALLGDAFFSFLKRRQGRPRGSPWVGPDQLDFVVGSWIGGLVLCEALSLAGVVPGNWFLAAFDAGHLVVIAIITPALHLLVNYIGYRIGAKEVPW